MRHPASHTYDSTAAGARARLHRLEAERAEALEAGLGSNGVYMDALRDDIEASRAAFVGLARYRSADAAIRRGALPPVGRGPTTVAVAVGVAAIALTALSVGSELF